MNALYRSIKASFVLKQRETNHQYVKGTHLRALVYISQVQLLRYLPRICQITSRNHTPSSDGRNERAVVRRARRSEFCSAAAWRFTPHMHPPDTLATCPVLPPLQCILCYLNARTMIPLHTTSPQHFTTLHITRALLCTTLAHRGIDQQDMARRYIAFVVVALCVALALHGAAAARTVPGTTGASTASLPAAAAASAGGKGKNGGAADKKNLFVGVGGMGDLPGFPAVGAGYGGGFGNNGGGVFTGVTGPLGGVGGGVGAVGPVGGVGGFGPLGGGGIPFGGFGGGGGAPFRGYGGAGGIGGGGAGGVTP